MSRGCRETLVLSPQAGVLRGEKRHGGGVGGGGGDRGARDLQVEAEDQQGVQRHVQQAAEHHAHAGLPGVALAAQQVAQRKARHRGHAAQHHDPEQVVLRVGIGIRARAEEPQQRPARKIGPQGEQQRRRRAAPDAERGDELDLPAVLRAHHAGDEAAAAQAEQVAQGREQVEPRGDQGHGRDHRRVAELPDEERVGQVVDHRDHLADDGGDGQRRHGPGDGHLRKQVGVRRLFHETCASFHKKSMRSPPPPGGRDRAAQSLAAKTSVSQAS